VGQPRDGLDNDGNARLTYVILEENKVVFRCLPFEWKVTARKIFAEPELDNFLGTRLGEGR
jgi:hypothetical protein